MTEFFKWLRAITRLHCHCLWRFRFVNGCQMEKLSYRVPYGDDGILEYRGRKDSCSCGKVFYKSPNFDHCEAAWKNRTKGPKDESV